MAAFIIGEIGPYDARWGTLGDASTWAVRAASYGLKVSKTPAAGTIAQWDFGHVAYVESLNYDSTGKLVSFVIIDDNWGLQVTTSRTIYVGQNQGVISYPDNFIEFPRYTGGGGGKPPVALGATGATF